MNNQNNVLGTPLEICSLDPMTGYTREGSCFSPAEDSGVHGVCAIVTEEFLDFSRRRGNDLSTPEPTLGFPGLKPGDRWCLCALRWKEASEHGVAPPVVLSATNACVLEFITRYELLTHAKVEGRG